jgi:sec-independent protein translocase protein TatA
MGLDNPIHIAILLVIVLLVFGAKRLPEMGQSLGSGLRGFKDSLGGTPDHAEELPAPTPIATHRAQESRDEDVRSTPAA